MTAAQVFSIANTAALAAWVLLAAMPRRRWVAALTGVAVPALFAAAYIVVVAANWGHSEGGFSSLEAVATLFANRWMLLAGWLHYLAFDLLIGNWEVHDARERAVPHLLVVPCLALTFLFGPAGWMLYRIVRARRS